MIIIRSARQDEILTLLELYRGYNRPAAQEVPLSELVKNFVEINRTGCVVVAEMDARIVGTYSIYFCANLAHSGRPFAVIENVIVLLEARRKGVGRALMEHAKQTARDRGCYKVMLATGAESKRNIGFYEACGFVGNKIGFQVRYGE